MYSFVDLHGSLKGTPRVLFQMKNVHRQLSNKAEMLSGMERKGRSLDD